MSSEKSEKYPNENKNSDEHGNQSEWKMWKKCGSTENVSEATYE